MEGQIRDGPDISVDLGVGWGLGHGGRVALLIVEC
jgi:hypothetical protein